MCGTRKIWEGKRRKGSKWWSDEIKRVVGRKKECFLIWRTGVRKIWMSIEE